MIKQQKRLRNFRQGRVNVRKERRKQLALRNNLEKRFAKKLQALRSLHGALAGRF